MVDLHGKDKGNISLPAKLQSYENDDEKKPTIINMQKTFYTIKIADIESRINRLDERNEELLEEIETTNELSATIDTETIEEITSLNKQFLTQNSLVESLKNKINTIENDRIENQRLHEEKKELFNQNYKKTKFELISQAKVLNAEINVLQDFKRVQNILQEKLEENEEQMVKNEKKVKETIEIVNRKIEFDKEMLKNEMYDCLLDLAAQFQMQVNKHINLPNQRLMRENIMLKHELLQISENISSKMDTELYLKNSQINYKEKLDTQSMFIKDNIKISKIQDIILEYIKKKLENAKKNLSHISIPEDAKQREYMILIEKTIYEQCNIHFRLATLKTILHKIRLKINLAKHFLKLIESKIRAVFETIYDLKYNATCLLKYPYSRWDLITMSCIEVFLFLRDILIKGQIKFENYVVESTESIPDKLESTSNIKENSNIEDINLIMFITKESLSKEILNKTKKIENLDEKKETLIENSEINETISEQFVETISEDNIDFNLENNYELSKDDEDESIFDIAGE
ncbi:nuclease SbcCD subunit C [Apis cerana]|uniref:nuclease SbcCD subunit C n=1 Tax=Apis cerana TaxID=7461 RepID=UPI002B229605|nr:nuclease SbcCD subunit C [Apis cerana]